MFEFFNMLGNHSERLVLRFEDKPARLTVDTARVSDGFKPFETGVAHPSYNSGKWVIVEAYSSPEAARSGHARWVRTMTGDLPDKLTDCCNSPFSQIVEVAGGQMDFPKDQP